MRTKQDKIFQIIGHIVMAVLSLGAIVPIVLLVMSSVTDNDALIRDGYSFFPRAFMPTNTYLRREIR